MLPGDARDGVLSRITRRQIVQIGAGFDTTYFRLRQKVAAPLTYLEVDYAEVVDKKARVINAKPELARQMMVGSRGVYPCELIAEDGDPPGRGYNPGASPVALVQGRRRVQARRRGSADVNSLTDAVAPTWTPEVPTLIVSECCLSYLEPEHARRWAVVREGHVARRGRPRSCCTTRSTPDAFGRQMDERGGARSPLREYWGARRNRRIECGDAGLKTRVRRHERDVGLPDARASDVARVVRLEIFDEIEEWRLMQAHTAWRGG